MFLFLFSIGVVSLVFFFHKYFCSRILEKKKYTNGVLLILFFLLGLEIDIPALMREGFAGSIFLVIKK